jgi:hypothetical protein
MVAKRAQNDKPIRGPESTHRRQQLRDVCDAAQFRNTRKMLNASAVVTAARLQQAEL